MAAWKGRVSALGGRTKMVPAQRGRKLLHVETSPIMGGCISD